MVHQFNEARTLGPVLAPLLLTGVVCIQSGKGEEAIPGTGEIIPFVKTEALLSLQAVLLLLASHWPELCVPPYKRLGKATIALPASVEEVEKGGGMSVG